MTQRKQKLWTAEDIQEINLHKDSPYKNKQFLDADEVKNILKEFHNGIHPKCNMCKLEKRLGLK